MNAAFDHELPRRRKAYAAIATGNESNFFLQACPSRSPFLVLLDTLSNAERRDLADQS